MLALWIIVGIVVYVNIGFFFGGFCWRVYKNSQVHSLTTFLFLWPFSGKDIKKKGPAEDCAPIGALSENSYKVIMAFFWSLKLAWSLLAWLVLGLVIFCFSFYIWIVRIVTLPLRQITGHKSFGKVSVVEFFFGDK